MRRIKLVRQHDIKDCAAACLSMICHCYNINLSIPCYREMLKIDRNGTNLFGIIEAAHQVGLKAEALTGEAEDFICGLKKKELHLPIIAHVVINNVLDHFVVVYKITDTKIYVADPNEGYVKYTYNNFFEIWTGHIISFEATENTISINNNPNPLIKFICILTEQKKFLGLIAFFSMLISSISIVGTFIFKCIIDSLNNSSISYNLPTIFIAILVLYLVKGLVQIIRTSALAKLSQRFDFKILFEYYNHILELPMNFFNNEKTGELLSRFNDAAKIREAMSSASLTLFLDTIMVVFCGAVLLWINKILFIISSIIVLIYVSIIMLFRKKISLVNRLSMSENAQLTSYLKESIDGIETIKAFDYEKVARDKTHELIKSYTNQNVKASIIYGIQDSLTVTAASVGTLALLWVGYILVTRNVLSLGTLITFYSLLGYFLEPMKNLINLQPTVQTALVAADRLNDILFVNGENEDKKIVQLNSMDINFRNVNFRYGFRELVLENINLNIKQGERIAIIGESGSGKTTLAKLIMGFYSIESGSLTIGDKEISNIARSTIRDEIAYISQNIFLFSDTIYNNIVMGMEGVTEKEVREVCQISMADQFIERMPLKYNTLLDENGANLSGGQKQRIAIARALLRKPSILIMDEATSNLDTITEQSIKKTILNLENQMTCIIIAHRLSTIKNCDKIIVLNSGKIVEMGTHEDLINRKGYYFDFWKNQN